MKNTVELSIKQRLRISRRMTKVAWQIRPAGLIGYFFGALLEIASFIASIYATAKLSSLIAAFIATGKTSHIWFWLWVDVASMATTGLAFLVMEYFKRMAYFSFVRWSINTFLGSLSGLDIGAFYNTELRNQINKVGGSYIWQMPEFSSTINDLIYGVVRFLAITAVVAQITWWLVPLIAVFLIPSLIGESRLAKMQWFVWDSKGDFRHVFWGLEYIVRKAQGQMELRSLQARDFVLTRINAMNETFYREQEDRYRESSKILVPTKILEVAGTAIGSVVVLKQLLSRSISLDRYFFLSGALLRIGGALNTIFGTMSRMQEHLLLADSFFELVDTKPQIVDKPNAVQLQDAPPHIVFDKVSFIYPGQKKRCFTKLQS